MKRRQFLKSSALAAGYWASVPALKAQPQNYALENQNLAWRLERRTHGVCPVEFENRLSGRRHPLQSTADFTLVFSQGQRLEIPWWNFQLTDTGDVAPEKESGLSRGFAKLPLPPGDWRPVNNLVGVQKMRVYQGYSWFRHEFSLPESVRGKDLILVLGGYDEQDWKHHWVYVNGEAIGEHAVTTRWHSPGRYALRPSDAAYRSLQFGPESRNLLAVRARDYDLRTGELSGDALEQYVLRPFLFDQFISIGEPYRRVSEFELRKALPQGSEKLSLLFENAENHLLITAHYELDGFVRRKSLEIHNQASEPALLLDVNLDQFRLDGQVTGGGHGKPIFLDQDAFCAIEHPAGINEGSADAIHLWHCPGRSIAPGATLRTKSAVIAAAHANGCLDQFHEYLGAKSPRSSKGRISIFTCFGTNNQWGACPTLNDVQVLDNQRVVGSWQKQNVKFDFFTLDTGWPAPDGDLTEFVNTCYPDGPARIIDGIHSHGMQFGLWFSEGWGGWANGLYPPIQTGAIPEAGAATDSSSTPPLGVYRNGYPVGGGTGRPMCMAAPEYYDVFRKAILHHVENNQARLIKFDSGAYYCNSTHHDHLPGKYSTEAMADRVIEIVEAARALAPKLFVMWYWGEGSPFWALYGDVISESGLFMEGSGTSQFPTLYYRDSVTLSLDQNTQFAKLIPPMNKDSLGVWLSQIRWGNFMGRERWQQALVMDLGRGSLVFPQLWGDPNLLNDDDVLFLAQISELARANDQLLRRPRRMIGDTWKNEPYAYAFCDGTRGLIFCNNVHFTARRLALPLGPSIGLSAKPGSALYLSTHYPEQNSLVPADGSSFRAGSTAEIWLRPFETLLLEIGSRSNLPPRSVNAQDAADLGSELDLKATNMSAWMDLKFADAERFEKAGMQRTKQCFSSRLPRLSGDRHMLAVVVQLTQNGSDYRYAPYVAEIVQIRGRLAGRDIQMIPVPDARRFGNTQHAGCSWVSYKIPLSSRHSEEQLEFAVHTYLPNGIAARTQAWVVDQWWPESGRPEADGFYGDSPS